jgi:hypothetical protein
VAFERSKRPWTYAWQPRAAAKLRVVPSHPRFEESTFFASGGRIVSSLSMTETS